MKIPYKLFAAFNAFIVLGLLMFSFYFSSQRFDFSEQDLQFIFFGMIVFVGLVLLYFPILLLMKSRTEGFIGMPLRQLAFATHPSMQLPRPGEPMPDHLSLVQKLEVFMHEDKRPKQAPVWKRVVAYGLDIIWIFVIIIPFMILSFIIKTPYLPSDSPALITFLVALTSLLVLFVVYLFIRDGFNGQSLGKRIMRIQVVEVETGKPIGFGKSALRYLFLRIMSVFELIPIFTQPNHRRMGDFFAKTMVVEK